MNARRAAPTLLAVLALLLTLPLADFLPGSSAAPPALSPAGQALAAPTLEVRVLRSLPHDAGAFTQGLLLHQGQLLESTGLYSQSSLRRTDPATGRVLAQANLPAGLFGEGLALCPPRPGAAPRLVQLTWREGLILTYDAASLRRLETRRLRGEGWGLAWDGTRLILSDGSDTLRFLEPQTFAETGRLSVREGQTPVRELNELEWVEGRLLANVLGQDRIAVIRLPQPPNAQSPGQVEAWLDLSPLRQKLGPQAEAANGVAYDPQARALYVTGKRWDKVFVLELPPILAQPPRPPPAKAQR